MPIRLNFLHFVKKWSKMVHFELFLGSGACFMHFLTIFVLVGVSHRVRHPTTYTFEGKFLISFFAVYKGQIFFQKRQHHLNLLRFQYFRHFWKWQTKWNKKTDGSIKKLKKVLCISLLNSNRLN